MGNFVTFNLLVLNVRIQCYLADDKRNPQNLTKFNSLDLLLRLLLTEFRK